MLTNNKGFTLIEMLIVLMIISVLIILIIPNLAEKSQQVSDKGCNALVSVVQTQVDAYHLENGEYPANLNTLKTDKYITADQMTCQNGKNIHYEDGVVSVPK
ncbi:competence protein ComGC [Oceanobacillus limi]|uniref:ComG operon protein 3 n=1 Tax=Oceanobacillus limi TaxID=930131 RepID=A0A1H9ZNT3_9BACI|nr:competence type IV pilus major pilin ComGC [Oceanobacillus limi]SES83421.1 competence protein ComGC [Oceanobacillus limi]